MSSFSISRIQSVTLRSTSIARRRQAVFTSVPTRPCYKARRRQTSPWRICASEVDDDVTTSVSVDSDSSFVPVFSLEELVKGERREIFVDKKRVVIFWYRNEILACEARSPAEGAYSEGLSTASLTENYGIICPTTKTVFSLKTGEILEWYPDNAMLRSIIPKDTCRSLEVYPVKIADGMITLSFKGGIQGGIKTMVSKGGAGTSAESSNIFGLESKMYFEGSDPENVIEPKTALVSNLRSINPASLLIGILAVAIVAVAGTSVAIYYESIYGGILFWIVLFSSVAFFITRTLGTFDETPSA